MDLGAQSWMSGGAVCRGRESPVLVRGSAEGEADKAIWDQPERGQIVGVCVDFFWRRIIRSNAESAFTVPGAMRVSVTQSESHTYVRCQLSVSSASLSMDVN